MEVPYQKLSTAALRGVVEEFVLRDGTDYGAEFSLDEKVRRVLEQLRCGEVVIVFDSDTETTNIIPRGR